MAIVDPAPFECIVVPPETRIVDGQGQHVVLRLTKELDFFGHPPKRMTPLTARRCMGAAMRPRDECLEIGLFGEWSNCEGQALVRLAIEVPAHVRVKLDGTLYGDRSRAAERTPLWWIRHRRADEEHWYAAPLPAPGWSRISDVPDPSR